MDPLALILLCVLCLVVLIGGRVAASVAIIASVCLMTMGQLIVIGPFHLHFFRLVILVGFARIIARGELQDLRSNRIDAAILVWLVVLMVTSPGHQDPRAQFTNVLGTSVNTVVVYFVFRALIRNMDDVAGVGRWLIRILLVVAIAMLAEKVTGHSAWERFGGVQTFARDGRFRAVGPFRHAILAGSVGAALLPFIVALRHRWSSLATLSASWHASP